MNETEIRTSLIKQIQMELGCPICIVLIDNEFNYLAKIQYEICKNEQIKNQIAREGGFCDFHFKQFKEIANGKTNVLLLKAIIETGAYKNKSFSIDCCICKYINHLEERIINSFIMLLKEENIKKDFENSTGLCFDHLKLITKLLENDNTIAWLNETHIKQIEKMQRDFDYMSSVNSFYEIPREKRKLINVLIAKLAGRKIGTL